MNRVDSIPVRTLRRAHQLGRSFYFKTKKALRVVRPFKRLFYLRAINKVFIPSLEICMTDLCNLRCENCASMSPFLRDRNRPDLEVFVETLNRLSRVARCYELRVLGGEPLLNKDICKFLKAAKQSKMFAKIKVVTNGLLLEKMGDDFWSLVDAVRISLYPGTSDRLTEAKLAELHAKSSGFGVPLELLRVSQFFEAISDTRITDQNVVERTFRECGEAQEWSCHNLYGNRLYRCGRVNQLERYLDLIGVEHEKFSELDGLLIDERPGLKKEIEDYLRSPIPLKACSFCLGTSGAQKDHRQLSVQEIRLKRAKVSHA